MSSLSRRGHALLSWAAGGVRDVGREYRGDLEDHENADRCRCQTSTQGGF